MSDYDYIRFEKNFNGKLDQAVFTTIRDDLQWMKHEGEAVEIRTAPKHELYTRAWIANVRNKPLSEIPTELLCLDTGAFNREDALSILGEYDIRPCNEVAILTLRRLDTV